MGKFKILLVLLVSSATMAPGYGRPSFELQIDRLITQYEESMEPHQLFAWMSERITNEAEWVEIEKRPTARIFRSANPDVLALHMPENIVWIDKSSRFFASYFPGHGSGGAVRLSLNGIQINASLYKDGSVLWAFVHPDGRIFSRKTLANGTVEYARR